MNATYERLKKEDKPVLAICYDFDKTLSPDDMQAQGYIQSVGCDVSEFWKESNGLAEKNDMDQNLAYMYQMRDKADGIQVFTKDTLKSYGETVKLFPGVETWFERIKEYGDKKGVIVEHYIISSGLKEMIEGTSVAKKGCFKKIYASSFYYNNKGVAVWPAQVVNYTNKTQFLFRIEKGVLNVNDYGVNDYFAPNEIRVPFRNMIYIGDSDTDIPCMKLVNSYGGHSIGVYNSDTKDKSKVYKMIRDSRIKYFAPANYTENSELDILVKDIIDRTVANEKLENMHFNCLEEMKKTTETKSKEDNEKDFLLMSLEESPSFFRTHYIIRELSLHKNWDQKELEYLCSIALENDQIKYTLNDYDVRKFYNYVINELGENNLYASMVLEEINRQKQRIKKTIKINR